MQAPSTRFFVLVKVACYTGAGVLGGFALGASVAGLFAPTLMTILGAAGAALGGALGTIASGSRSERAPSFSRRHLRAH